MASLDRLGRNVAERVRAYEELKALGVTIHSAREGGIVSEFTYNILAAVAQEESRKLSERVRGSWRYFEEHGWKSRAVRPGGTRSVPRRTPSARTVRRKSCSFSPGEGPVRLRALGAARGRRVDPLDRALGVRAARLRFGAASPSTSPRSATYSRRRSMSADSAACTT